VLVVDWLCGRDEAGNVGGLGNDNGGGTEDNFAIGKARRNFLTVAAKKGSHRTKGGLVCVGRDVIEVDECAEHLGSAPPCSISPRDFLV
jgi:hypothetical protein